MIFFTIGFVVVTLLAGLWDFLFYRIPNSFVAFLLLLFIVMALFLGINDWIPLVIGFLTTLVIGFILSAFRVIGAGDAKLLAALSPWIIYAHFMGAYLLMVCLLSGILGILYYFSSHVVDSVRRNLLHILAPLFNRIPFCHFYMQADFIPAFREKRLQSQVPFGLAISIGALFSAF